MASPFTPLASPPPGFVTDFDNPTDSLSPTVKAIGALCAIITTLFTIARLVAKRSIGAFTLEDYTLIATWFLFMGYLALGIQQGSIGLGRHIWDVRATDAPMISQISWAIMLSYCPLMFLAKATIVLQLQHTFAPTRKRDIIYVTFQSIIWLNLAYYLATFLALVLECIPTERIWEQSITTTGYCIDVKVLLISMSAINILSDICILLLPIWAIWQLHMKVEKRLGISAIFSIGVLSVISSIGRMIYTIAAYQSEDTTYGFAKLELWSFAEVATIILCICFPLIPRMVAIVRARRVKNNSSSSGSSDSNSNSKDRAAYHTAYPLNERRGGAGRTARTTTTTITALRTTADGQHSPRSTQPCGVCDGCITGFSCRSRGLDGLGGRGGIERQIVMSVVTSKDGGGRGMEEEEEEEKQGLRWAAARPAEWDVNNGGRRNPASAG